MTLPYEFIQNISEGSFGRVYMARDPQSGGVVAIKEPMTYSLAGTRGYIAPEVLMGADFHSGADIYSLGMVAVELLTGKLDPVAVDSTDAPDGLKSLTRAMISHLPTSRPNIQRVAQLLTNIISPLCTPKTSQPAPTPTPVARPQNVGAEVAVAVGIGAALLAAIGGLAYLAANSPEWDGQVQRYRGKDGQFRS